MPWPSSATNGTVTLGICLSSSEGDGLACAAKIPAKTATKEETAIAFFIGLF